MASTDEELEGWLQDAGKQLASPPMDNLGELQSLLDFTEKVLLRVQQCPSKSTLDVLRPTMDALIEKKFMGHPDEDVKVTVTSCINEIMRITAPDAPYNDDLMKEVFQNIVDAFEKLDDISNGSFTKRVMILDTVSKVRSCIMMLDLQCDALILDMFRIFLRTIRPEHSETVFSSMRDIMTVILDESEDIPSELISCLLDAVKSNNKDILPIARKLGERVIADCALKLKPYLVKLSKSKNSFLSKYSKVVASVCEGNSERWKRKNINSSANDMELASAKKRVDCSESIPAVDSNGMGKESDGETINLASPNPLESSDTTRSKSGGSHSSKLSAKKHGASGKLQPREADVSGEPSTVKGNSGRKVEKLTGRKHKVVTGGSSEKQKITNIKQQHRKDTAGETSAKNSERPAQLRELDDRIVGARVKVWWPDDKAFYKGVVAEYDHSTKKHKIEYDDGDVEILLLKDERWEFIGDFKIPHSTGKSKDTTNHDPSSKELSSKKLKKSSETTLETPLKSGTTSSGSGGAELSKKKGRPPKAGTSSHSPPPPPVDDSNSSKLKEKAAASNKSKDGIPAKAEEKSSSRNGDNKSDDRLKSGNKAKDELKTESPSSSAKEKSEEPEGKESTAKKRKVIKGNNLG